MESSEDKRNLRDYIVKLNDRNIQRQRESGFTLYAILGAIVYAVIYLIDNLRIPISICENDSKIMMAAFVCNAFLSFYFFYLSFVVKSKNARFTKILPFRKSGKVSLEDFPLVIVAVLCLWLNIYCLLLDITLLQKIYLWLFVIIVAANAISAFAYLSYKVITKWLRTRKGKVVEQIDFNTFDDNVTIGISVGTIFWAIVLFAFTITAGVLTKMNLTANIVSDITKYLLTFFGTLHLARYAMVIYNKQRDNNHLEDFEKQIFFEDLSNEQIAKTYEHEFDGIPFSKWIVTRQKEIMNFFEQCRSKFADMENRIVEVNALDKTALPYEVNGRLSILANEQAIILAATADFVQRVSKTFSSFQIFASLNNSETQELEFVQNLLNQGIAGFNNQYGIIAKQIEDCRLK